MTSAPPILLAGGGRLAGAIAALLEDAGVPVRRFVAAVDVPGGDPAQLLPAAALVLAADDDAGNVDLCLWARRLRSDLPIVARIFDQALATFLSDTVDGVTILSVSQVAAPMFAEAALRTLDAPAAARPRSATAPAALPAPVPRRRWAPPDRVLLGALVGLALVVLPATLYFSAVLGLRLIDSLYFVWTTVMTVGYGDISLANAPDEAKVVGMVLMLAGAAFVATLFAFLTGWVVTRRLDVQSGRVQVRARDHLVIAGAGNLGFRVARLLAASGRPVVIIERHGDNPNVAALRADGHHVIIASAASDAMLTLAGIDRARAVLALTDSDAVNLKVALLARERGSPAAVVMRLFSPELSAHAAQRGDGVALSPIATAATAFVKAVLASRGR